jgi:hypothetical protein
MPVERYPIMARITLAMLVAGLTVMLLCAIGAESPKLTARIHNSGFAEGHDTYNGLSAAPDGRIYYVLSSEKHDVPAEAFCFDPATAKIERLGDLTTACGEKGSGAIVQGKSHVNFIEANGRLHFATHIGYYSIRAGMETLGDPPAGWKPYRGGHFLALDVKTRKFDDLGIAPMGEGILSMTMDRGRGILYGLTWPTGRFLRCDVATRKVTDLGTVSGKGEAGRDKEYRTLCRSMVVDPGDGSVYFTNSEGDIRRYSPASGAIELVEGADLRKDYFGLYDPTSPGHMGYNWRQTLWYAPEESVYGVHGNSGYLFRFFPRTKTVEVLDRITSLPSKRSGMFDQFSYGYLGFTLGPDGRTIHYLTGGPVYRDGRRVEGKKTTAMGESKGIEDLHLVTWDIPSGKYTDRGTVMLENGDRPAYVNSIAVGKDGTVYTLSRITEKGRTRTDLISIPAAR